MRYISGYVEQSVRCNHLKLKREDWTWNINLGSFSVWMIFKEILLVEITRRVSLDKDQLKGLKTVNSPSVCYLPNFPTITLYMCHWLLGSPLSGEKGPACRWLGIETLFTYLHFLLKYKTHKYVEESTSIYYFLIAVFLAF